MNDEPERVTQHQEREALRASRDQLRAAGEQIRSDVDRYYGMTDPVGLRALVERLSKHNDALARYHARLDAFHVKYGPIGE